MKNKFLILLAIFAIFTLSSCSENSENSEVSNTEKPQAVKISEEVSTNLAVDMQKAKNNTEPQNVDEPFDFTYNDLDDKPVSLSDFRGKWVIVNFWATWCPPCRKEIPDFIKFKEQYGDTVEILGINNEDADIEIIRAFAEDYKVNYPILRADVYNPSEFDKQNTMGLPTTVIFNPQGIQVSKRVGPMHFKDLQEVIGVQ